MRPVCIARTLYHQQAGPAHSKRFERQAELDWLRAQANEPAARKIAAATTSERREFC